MMPVLKSIPVEFLPPPLPPPLPLFLCLRWPQDPFPFTHPLPQLPHPIKLLSGVEARPTPSDPLNSESSDLLSERLGGKGGVVGEGDLRGEGGAACGT